LADAAASTAALRRQELESKDAAPPDRRLLRDFPRPVDRSVLAIATTKRHRSREHLRRVAALPCLVCGRRPSHAHHLRFAQSRGLGLKVSDEFTVPLCAIDHDALHRSGDERAWWHARGIDPLPEAERLWRSSVSPSVQPAEAPDAAGAAHEKPN
jgi:hypothetical protein